MADNDHLLNIVMAFRATGLGEIRAAFDKEMAAIAAGAKGVTSGTPDERRRQTRVGTESAITDWSMNAPHSEVLALAKDISNFRRAMSTGTKGFEGLGSVITETEKQRLRRSYVGDETSTRRAREILGPTGQPINVHPRTGIPVNPSLGHGPIVPEVPNKADVYDQAQNKADRLAFNTAVQEMLKGSKAYTAELVREKTLHAQMSTQLNTALAASKAYISAVVADANATRKLSTRETTALRRDPDYVKNVAKDNTAAARLARAEALATEQRIRPKDITEIAELKTLKAKNARAVELIELQNSLSNGTAKELAEIRALTETRKRAEAAFHRQKTARDIPAIAQDRYDASRRAANIAGEQAKLGDVSTVRGRFHAAQDAQTQIAETQRSALIRRIVAEEQASNSSYLATKAATRLAEKERADRIKAAALGVSGATDKNVNIEEVRARSAVAHRAQENERAAAAIRATTTADIEASVQTRIAQNRLDGAIKRKEREYIKEALNRGELGGTGFQRLQSRFSARGAAPEEFSTIGQFVGQKALTAGAYTLVGTALYGSISAIKEMIKESEELDRVLNQVKAQFNGIGEGDEFGKFREDILAISRETGVAADKVAFVGFQFKGAFGTSEEAVKNLSSAMKITQVTGLSLEETVDSLTATSKTYGISITDIGDKAIGLEERFGVLSKQTITFTADIAAVADQAGLSFEKVAALGAVAQQVSGRSGAALAESWGRVLPAIQDSSGEILSLYATLNNQGLDVASTDKISANLGAGKTGEVIESLIRDYDKLSQSQKNYLITLLGQRKESQALIPVFENSAKVVEEWDRVAGGAEDDTGKLGARFRDLGETMHNTFQRAGEMWRQFGTALFELGLADIFVKAGNAAGALLAVITKIAQVVGFLFKIPYIGDFIGQLVQIGVLAYGVTKLYGLMTIAIQAVSHAQARATATTTTLTGATGLEAEVSTTATGALSGQAAATNAVAGANARAAATSTGTSAANAGTVWTRGGGFRAAPPPPSVLNSASTVSSLYDTSGTPLRSTLASSRLLRNSTLANSRPATWARGLTTAGGATQISGGMTAAIGAAGAIAVVSKYMDERGEVEKTAMEFGTKLKQADEGKLKAFVDASDGQADESELSPFLAAMGPIGVLANKLGTQFFGVTDPEIQAIQEWNERRTADSKAMFKALLARDKKDKTTLTEGVLKDVNKGNQATVLAHFTGEGGGGDNADIRELLEESFAGGDDGRKAFAEMLKRANDGDVAAQEAIEFLGRVLKTQQNYAGDILDTADPAAAAAARAKAAESVGGEDQLSLLLVDSVKQLEKLGEVSSQTVLKKIEEELALHENLRAEAEKNNNSIEAKKQIAVILQLKTDQQAVNDLLRGRATELRGIVRAFAGLDDPSAKLNDIATQIGDPTLLTPQRLALNGPAVEALKAKFQDELEGTGDHVNDAFERLAILRKGVDAPLPLQRNLIEGSLNKNQEKAVFDTAHVFGRDPRDIMDKATGIVADRDVNILQALDSMYEDQIAELEANLADIGREGGDTADQQGILERTRAAKADIDKQLANDPGRNGSVFEKLNATAKEIRDAQFAVWDREVSLVEAETQLSTTQNTGNPLVQIAGEMAAAEAQLRAATKKKDPLLILQAQNAVAAAQRHALENDRDITKAMLERDADTGDPLADAKANLALAQEAEKNAREDAFVAGSGAPTGAAKASADALAGVGAEEAKTVGTLTDALIQAVVGVGGWTQAASEAAADALAGVTTKAKEAADASADALAGAGSGDSVAASAAVDVMTAVLAEVGTTTGAVTDALTEALAGVGTNTSTLTEALAAALAEMTTDAATSAATEAAADALAGTVTAGAGADALAAALDEVGSTTGAVTSALAEALAGVGISTGAISDVLADALAAVNADAGVGASASADALAGVGAQVELEAGVMGQAISTAMIQAGTVTGVVSDALIESLVGVGAEANTAARDAADALAGVEGAGVGSVAIAEAISGVGTTAEVVTRILADALTGATTSTREAAAAAADALTGVSATAIGTALGEAVSTVGVVSGAMSDALSEALAGAAEHTRTAADDSADALAGVEATKSAASAAADAAADALAGVDTATGAVTDALTAALGEVEGATKSASDRAADALTGVLESEAAADVTGEAIGAVGSVIAAVLAAEVAALKEMSEWTRAGAENASNVLDGIDTAGSSGANVGPLVTAASQAVLEAVAGLGTDGSITPEETAELIRTRTETDKQLRKVADEEEAIAQAILSREIAGTRDPIQKVRLKIQAARQKLEHTRGDAAKEAVRTEIDDLGREEIDDMNAAADSAFNLRIGNERDPYKQTQLKIQLARTKLNRAVSQGAGAVVINELQGELDDLSREVAEKQSGLAEAILNRQAANSRDPVRQVELKIQAARAKLAIEKDPVARENIFSEIEQLQREQVDNMNAIADSELNRRVAGARDPFQALVLKTQLAQTKLNRARADGNALAVSEAQGELDQLTRDMADLFERAVQGRVGLAVTIAEGKGDHLGAAKLQLNEAQRRLDKAIAEGAGGEEITALRQELARQQAASADALMSDRTDDIDFMLEMGQITSRQAVAMLEALLNIPSIRENQDRVRSIQRKIHSLNQELKQDLQFNLPTVDIQGLYYQANRVNQTRMAGQGYQDNRQISVVVPDAGNPAATAMAVAQALSGGSAGGPQYTSGQRRYP